MPQQEVVIAALAEMAFKKQPPKSLIDFIYKIQKKDAFIYSIYDQLA
jgi:hypothetical protein